MQKMAAIVTLTRALSIRAVPGLVNLFSLMLLARVVSASTYGLFSTTIATAGLVANIVFGFINLTIVSQYSGRKQQGNIKEYISTVMTMYFSILITIFSVGLIIILVIGNSNLIIVTVTFMFFSSFHGVLQEITRAREDVFRYGASDFLQSIFMLFFFIFYLDINSSYMDAVVLYSLSYAFASSLNIFYLRDVFSVGGINIQIARETIKIGKWLVAANISENILYIGSRYVILWQAGAGALGAFSFAVDMAQRTIGFIVNAAGFVYIPRAFSVRAQLGYAAFRRVLFEGVIVGGGVAIFSAAILPILFFSLNLDFLFPKNFEVFPFFLIVSAIIFNRTKKGMYDQLFIANGSSYLTMAVSVPCSFFGVLLVYIFSFIDSNIYIYIGYSLGYLMALVISFFIDRAFLGEGRINNT